MTTSFYESLTHSKWDCKYHLVFISKYRRKELYGKVLKYLTTVFHELASQRDTKIMEGHTLISIPPKYAVAEVVEYLKGKSAVQSR
jgi:putative transposase